MYGKRGFTLLEILVVVVIATSVLFFAVPSYKRSKDKSAYTAAQGVLVELRSAMLSMRQDLHNVNPSLSVPPNGAIKLNSVWQNKQHQMYGIALNTPIENISGDTILFALFAKGYLQPIPLDANNKFSRYEFYLCPATGSSSNCCNNNRNVVACMQDTNACSRPTRGLYAGARILEDGQIIQFSENCQ